MCMPPRHQHYSRYSGPLSVGIWKSWWDGSSSPCHEGVFCTTYPPTKPLSKWILRTNSTVSDEKRCFEQSRGSFQNYCLMSTQPTILSQSVLLWGKVEIASVEGIQQGDPLGPLLFCLSIHDLVSSLKSEYKVFYLDNGTIGDTLEDTSAELTYIEKEGKQLGLRLNVAKSELICNDSSRA